MDWRGRKYYVATFPPSSYDMRIGILKNMGRVTLHSPPSKDSTRRNALPDEAEPRGYYHVLIGCNYGDREAVEYELRKAERNDENLSSWKEIKRDVSKKYFDVYGFEIPYRRCGMNPNWAICPNCGNKICVIYDDTGMMILDCDVCGWYDEEDAND